jgi:hypothetical protein
MKHIRENIQESLDDYTLKEDIDLINMICDFGSGFLEFHTADIERLIREKSFLKEKVDDLIELIKNKD